MRGPSTETSSHLLSGGPSFDSGLHAGRPAISRAERTVTLLMLGRLKYQGNDTICRIRNVSAGGMRIDTGSPLEEGEYVAVEARNGESIDGRIVWTGNLTCGIAFAGPVDHQALLVPPMGPSGRRLAARSPRFRASAAARLQTGGRQIELRVVDISLGGCRVESDAAFPLHAEGCLTIPGLPALACTSKWATGNRAGLVFHGRPEFVRLAQWLDDHRARFTAAAPGSPAAQPTGGGMRCSMPFSHPRSF